MMRRILGFSIEDNVFKIAAFKVFKSKSAVVDAVYNVNAVDLNKSKNLFNKFLNYDEIVFLFPRHKLIEKRISVPSLELTEIRKILGWMIPKCVPYKKGEFVYSISRVWKEKDSSTVLVHIASKAMLESYYSHFKMSGLYPTKIVADTYPVFEFYKEKYKKLFSGESPVIIHMGFKETQIIFSNEGKVSFSRTIPIGEEDFARAIVQQQSLSENIKKALTIEIAKTFQFYAKENKGFTFKTVILNSVFKKMVDIKSEINEIFNASVIFLSDEHCVSAEEVPVSVKFMGIALIKSYSAGMVPKELVLERKKFLFKKGSLLNAVLGGALASFIALFFVVRGLHNADYLKRLNQELAGVKEEVGNIQISQKKINYIGDYINSKEPALEILKNLGGILPKDVKITELEYSRKDGLFILGEAPKISAVIDVAKKMDQNEIFSNVTTENISAKNNRRLKDKVVFQIRSKVIL